MSLATVANIGMSYLGGLLSATVASAAGAPAAVGAGALVALTLGLVVGLAPGWYRVSDASRPAPTEAPV